MKKEEQKLGCFLDAKNYILEGVRDVLSSNDVKNINEAVKAMLAAKQIFIYGVGRSGLVGKAFAMRLVQVGFKAYFIGETITPIVEEGDAVVIISRTGETMSAIQTANIVRRVGAKLIIVTESKGSKLAHTGNIVIYINVRADHNKKHLAPLGTLFEDSSMILFDAMVSEIMSRIGESEETMRARHAIWV